jgi:hypothetical protein
MSDPMHDPYDILSQEGLCLQVEANILFTIPIVVVVVPKGTVPYQSSGILLEQTKCLIVDIKAYFPLAQLQQSELVE